MKVIFLDIDGVLNSEDYAIYRYYGHKVDEEHAFIDKRAIIFLNYILKETDAELVLSSSWRGSDTTNQVLKDNGLSKDLFDSTPYLDSRFRGDEIQKWIDDYESNNPKLESYVIIDDDTDMRPEQKENFVHCDCFHGLTSIDCYKAIDILNKTNKE